MAKISGQGKEDAFQQSLQGRDIPVLTLDNKWYRLLDRVGLDDVKELENQLSELLKRQGKVNTETKEIKKIKKRLMEEIVSLADAFSMGTDPEAERKIAENKRLVGECNEKLDAYQEEILELPREIDQVNRRLMVLTMEHCYDTMSDYTDEIEALDEWVRDVRIKLKKNLVRKQEMEAKNHEIYSYMHDIFGAEVVNLFDMRYNPEEKHPQVKANEPEGNETQDSI